MNLKPLLTTILFSFLLPTTALCQTNKGDPFRRYIKTLPEVDRIEVLELKPLLTDEVKSVDCHRADLVCAPDNFPYEIGPSRSLVGEHAKRFAALWRALERDSLHRDRCLVPDHALRFFQGDKILLETQVCTLCRKVTLPEIGVVSVAGSNSAPYYRFQNALLPDSSFEQLREQFKLKMMPNVGHEISLIGLIVDSKSALTIAYGGGEIEVTGVDITRLNKLINLGCHTALKVTGTLQYFKESNSLTTEVVQPQPSHFYIHKPQIEVVRVEDVRKKPKKT
ncbi:MAG TPA: hypothetical protein VLB68_05325 [Pyrinomonadaceae bacterium]|nr:hypothetical protein [Pyrinomonadaceae bacterium]